MGQPKLTTPWIHDAGLRKLYLLLPIALLSSSYQGFDGMIMNGLQILPSWQQALHHPKGPVLGLLNSIQSVGATLALPFIPYFTDKLGRRHSIVFGASFTVVGAVLQATSHNIAQFVVARFLIGFGLAFTVVAAPLLLVELALPKHRGLIMSLFPTLWFTGAIVAAWTTYGTQHIKTSLAWRIPSFLQGIPAVIQILGIYFLPESPRWLISKGRDTEARQILTKYHANGDSSNPIVDLEYKEITQAISTDEQHKRNGSWKDLYRTAANRRRLGIIFFCGLFIEISGNGLVAYYLRSILVQVGITSVKVQTTINGCLSIYNFVIALIASLYVEKIGRRPLFLISTVGMFIAFVLWTSFAALYTTEHSVKWGIGVLVCIFLSNGSYAMGWTPLWSYPTEVLPYEIRARGMAFSTGVQHIFAFFATFVNPIGLQNIGWKYYIAYIVFAALELFVVWFFFVETRGYTLEQINHVFEAPDLTWKQRRNLRASGDIFAQSTAIDTESISQRSSAGEKEATTIVSEVK